MMISHTFAKPVMYGALRNSIKAMTATSPGRPRPGV